ncbi:unnamed protein product [Lactuca saligna]|uniref:Extensin n=1 Tax=Lactuca saligna TaxID=75948 RepID=A0AA35YLF5_LACSI|nr:unnamed protein product [Lactuca saligna]
MASRQLLSALLLLLLHLTLNSPPSTVAQCPYPCYPPPTGTGGNTNTPPVPQTGNYPPPATIYTPPSSVYPYNPPTPTFYGGAPPPPDPIVPWFPYYYKDPPRNPNKSSSADLPRGSTAVIFMIHILVFRLFLLLS